ncbi:MAG TPA: hypothetical protein VFR84_12595 [Candidatus Angelobacter sp.]|nr:hypothetical protein [Candidatus Angelobacter sp.]
MKAVLQGIAVLLCSPAIVSAQTQPQDHSKHQQMEHRGNQGMGFDQQKTIHHFLLRKDGGVIQVTTKSAADKESVEEIRMHLQHIRRAFQSGEFNIPMFVHDQTPPGVPVMTKLKNQIHYKYEPAENGGRVLISSENPAAVAAMHQFLQFQITEHQTGDPLEVK